MKVKLLPVISLKGKFYFRKPHRFYLPLLPLSFQKLHTSGIDGDEIGISCNLVSS